MTEQYDKLTLQETEELCRLYMDCNLSVFEETELRYFLSRADYHSPLIDEVRQIMDSDLFISDKPFNKVKKTKKILSRQWIVSISIAASIAVCFSLGLFFFRHSSIEQNPEQSLYIAYADGNRLSEDAAKLQIKMEIKSADEFIREMSELEAREKQIIENFPISNFAEQ